MSTSYDTAVTAEDRFEELLGDVSGFYRSWLVYLGLELGLLAALARESSEGVSAPQLAASAGCARGPVDGWCRAAYAYRIVEATGGPEPRYRLDPDLATVLLDERSPEYVGGQFAFTVGASLDYGGMVDFFRSGRPVAERSARYHRSVERLNAQDTQLFLEDGIPALPELGPALSGSTEVLDVACGDATWLIGMARAYPSLRLAGVEHDADWLARAQERVLREGLTERISVERADPADLPWAGRFALVHLQNVVHELPDPVGALADAWRAVARGGSLIVMDWPLPSDLSDYRTPHGELVWGYQLDELYGGTSLVTRERFVELFAAAGIGAPRVVELAAGALLLAATRS